MRFVASDKALWAATLRCGWRRTEECLGRAERSSKSALKEWKRVRSTRKIKQDAVFRQGA